MVPKLCTKAPQGTGDIFAFQGKCVRHCERAGGAHSFSISSSRSFQWLHVSVGLLLSGFCEEKPASHQNCWRNGGDGAEFTAVQEELCSAQQVQGVRHRCFLLRCHPDYLTFRHPFGLGGAVKNFLGHPEYRDWGNFGSLRLVRPSPLL